MVVFFTLSFLRRFFGQAPTLGQQGELKWQRGQWLPCILGRAHTLMTQANRLLQASTWGHKGWGKLRMWAFHPIKFCNLVVLGETMHFSLCKDSWDTQLTRDWQLLCAAFHLNTHPPSLSHVT